MYLTVSCKIIIVATGGAVNFEKIVFFHAPSVMTANAGFGAKSGISLDFHWVPIGVPLILYRKSMAVLIRIGSSVFTCNELI